MGSWFIKSGIAYEGDEGKFRRHSLSDRRHSKKCAARTTSDERRIENVTFTADRVNAPGYYPLARRRVPRARSPRRAECRGEPSLLPSFDRKKASSLDDRIRDRQATKFPNYERRRPPSVVPSSVNAPSWPEVQLELNRFRSCNHWKPLANYYWSRSHSIITVRRLPFPVPLPSLFSPTSPSLINKLRYPRVQRGDRTRGAVKPKSIDQRAINFGRVAEENGEYGGETVNRSG